MAKKINYKEKSKEELHKLLAEKRAALRKNRFGSAGARSKDTQEEKNTRKEIARILTELNSRVK